MKATQRDLGPSIARRDPRSRQTGTGIAGSRSVVLWQFREDVIRPKPCSRSTPSISSRRRAGWAARELTAAEWATYVGDGPQLTTCAPA